MTKTPNYSLPQWESTDQVKMSDFNDLTSKVDAALAEKGNCRISVGTYTGTGTSVPRLELDVQPKLLVVMGQSVFTFLTYGDPKGLAVNTSTADILDVTWEDGYVSWRYIHSTDEMRRVLNASGVQYTYILFY